MNLPGSAAARVTAIEQRLRGRDEASGPVILELETIAQTGGADEDPLPGDLQLPRPALPFAR